MTTQERADYIMRKLEELYPNPSIPLSHKDPYTLLIAVLLSAQCTDARVNQVTPKLFALADNPNAMLSLGQQKIQEIIRPCGLSNNKSRAIIALSQTLLDKYNGQVPKTLEDLESLQGVGHKTASVIMVQAFNTPAFPVDTHIHRLAKRWHLSSGKNVAQTEKDLKLLFPINKWAKLHLQIIYYARQHCTARGCDGSKCEICRKLNLS